MKKGRERKGASVSTSVLFIFLSSYTSVSSSFSDAHLLYLLAVPFERNKKGRKKEMNWN